MILKVKRHRRIEYFNEFSVNLNYDAVASSFSFSLFFDPTNELHRVLFQPGHYHEVEIEHNGELLIRGWVLNQTFGSTSNKVLSSVSGYSLPGVLEDCEIPTDLYPLQSDGRTLLQIAQRFCSKFSFSVVVDPIVAAKMNTKFDTSTASETQTIKGYLTELAFQKKIVLSHTPDGDLLFTEANTKKAPIYHFEKDMVGTEMSLSINGQSMHSHLTIQKQASSDGGNAGEIHLTNPFVPYVYRPSVKSQSSGTDNDTNDAARMALAAEVKNIVLTITTNVWEIDGKLIKPNNIVTVKNDECFLFKTTRWFIRGVSFKGNEKQTTAVLTCVLPEVYNNEPFVNIFEDMVDWRTFHRENHL